MEVLILKKVFFYVFSNDLYMYKRISVSAFFKNCRIPVSTYRVSDTYPSICASYHGNPWRCRALPSLCFLPGCFHCGEEFYWGRVAICLSGQPVAEH
jgi:hypothetical protein